MSQKHKVKPNQQNIFKQSFIAGVCGTIGVFCQTTCLLWHFNVHQEQIQTRLSFRETGILILKNGGIKKLYHGFLSSYKSASLARFGDTSINTMILKQISYNSKLKKIPIFLKSFIVWTFASTWRLILTPLLVLTDQFSHIWHHSIKKGSIPKSIFRIYLKRTKPEILALYFWFTFHNYSDYFSPPMAFKDKIFIFLIRHSIVGFGSMVCYDFLLASMRLLFKVEGRHTHHNLLLGDCHSKTIIKGLHGTFFCATTNFAKLQFSKSQNKY